MSLSATDIRLPEPPGPLAEPGSPQAVVESPDLVIKARRGWIAVNWRELFSHRELLFFLIWRDVKVKYKQAILGVAWAVFVPLISVVLFTVIGKAAGFDSKVSGTVTLKSGQVVRGTLNHQIEASVVRFSAGPDQVIPASRVASESQDTVTLTDGTMIHGVVVTHQPEAWMVKRKQGDEIVVPASEKESVEVVPYAIFVYAGMLPWLFFQAAITGGGMSLVSQQNLLSKIYLPRLFMPTATVGSALIDMGLSALVFCGMAAVYRFAPSSNVWALIPLLVLTIIGGLGFAYLLSALTVIFRDMRFLIPFLSQMLMWVSGAMYPPRIFGSHENWLAVNPVYGVISGFRSAILGEPWNWMALAVATLEIAFLFLFGLFYFRRAERRFADIA